MTWEAANSATDLEGSERVLAVDVRPIERVGRYSAWRKIAHLPCEDFLLTQVEFILSNDLGVQEFLELL